MQVYLQMPAFFVFHSAKHFTEPKRSEGEVVCSGYYSEAEAKLHCSFDYIKFEGEVVCSGYHITIYPQNLSFRPKI